MKSISKKIKITLIVCSIAVFVFLTFAIPIGVDLYRISEVADQYRLEEAVHTNVMNDSIHKPKISEFLNPSFMKKYNLDTKDYQDAEGYFCPKGTHWILWSIETKTVAVLMWNKNLSLTAWDINRVIKRVDAYYTQNDRSIPVLEVVQASLSL